MMQLVKYDAACRALSVAKSVDEAKDFRDKAEAMRAYARQAKNKQLEVDAAEIRFRAERRIGELMAAQRDAGLLANGGDAMRARVANGPEVSPPTLSEAGIDKHLADRARKYAAIPEDEFNGIVGEWRDRVEGEQERVRTNLLESGAAHVHVAANSGNNEWYTPPEIIEAARSVLGGFDLDPASSDLANKTVGAERYFTADDNGLELPWPAGRLWMNPPYSQPLVAQFCEKFVDAVSQGSTGIVLVNNATETAWFQGLADGATSVCFLRGRVKYLNDKGIPANTPLQGQALVYFGPDASRFKEVFSSLGLVLSRCRGGQ